MKKTKLLFTSIIVLLIIDMIHFFIYRLNPTYSEITEAFYENQQMTFIKWGLLIVSVIGLYFLNKNEYSKYLIGLSSIGMIAFFLSDGPLFHIYKMYSETYLWLLFILGISLLIFFLISFRSEKSV